MARVSGPVTLPPAPLRGVVGITEQPYAEACSGVTDPAIVRARPVALVRAGAAGAIGEDEAARQEDRPVRRPWPAGADRHPEV
ncbi:gas vesicle protein GvpG [Kitasatospora sp. DSM 101779]|uniref:gas vesicle protein GvpG n=1 Tax=Kitasatospora sp. DSM 101779 TaxID=2853165 RepID=UPI0021D87FC7|nr:gas vesicle protein GvpG [Kitasatospora sp. DSM 101779]MCU7826297.1 gas vesicle protein GvpG [Kitasatospora sp. DSM 101779]